MKKTIRLIALLLCMTMLFAGCSGDADDETESAAADATENNTESEEEYLTRGEYTASDYCSIDNYLGITFAEEDIAASDDDVQSEIDTMLADATELVERGEDEAAEDGDTVNIDYTGYLDGEAFDNGSDTDYDLVLGSDTFIDGFEDGLIGAKAGDELSLELTFPDTYTLNTDLAGQDVVFEVTVNSVSYNVTPDYTDETVAANTDYTTIEEYEEALRAEIRETNLASALADKLYELAEFTGEYPESLENYYKESYAEYYDYIMQIYYGYTLDEYLELIGTDLDTFLEEQFGDYIDEYMQGDLLLEVIADQEGIYAEGEDYEAFVAEQAESYGMEEDEFVETYGDAEIEFVYRTQTAYDLVYDSMIIE